MIKHQPKSTAGFTIIEVVVGLVIVGVAVAALSNLFITITGLQRQNEHLSLATRIAEQKIESLRNNHYNTLPLSPPTLDFSAELPSSLAEPRTAEVNISEPRPGIKRLDITISYREGSRSKTVKLSALLGNIGLSQ